MPSSLSRRAALLGAAASSAALAIPAVAAVAPTEHPNEKVCRLGHEIKDALNDPAFVGFDKIVITRNYVGYSYSADPETEGLEGLPLAAVHVQRAIDAMGDFHFGKWEVTIRSGEPDQNWGFRQIAPSDPLIAAIDAYRAGCEAFRNTPDHMTAEEEDAAIAATFGPPMEVLAAWDKPALSLAGVAAALRLAADENMGVLGSDISQTMVRAALGYIDPNHRPTSRI